MKEIYNLLEQGKQIHCAVGSYTVNEHYMCKIFWLKNGLKGQGTLVAQSEECETLEYASQNAYVTFFNKLNACTKDSNGHTKLYHLYKNKQLPGFCLYYIKMFRDDLKVAPFTDFRMVVTLLELMGYQLQMVETTNRFVIQKKSNYAGAKLSFDAFD